MINRQSLFLSFIGILSLTSNLSADQYFTDTPVPTEYTHVKITFASRITHKERGTSIRTPLIQASVGLYPDVQGQFFGYGMSSIKKGASTQYGFGDVGVGLKYRFLHETVNRPQIAFYPKFRLPSGDTSRGIGNKGALERFPLWAQKSLGPWKLTGGGGYAFNQGPMKVNYAYGGILLRRAFGETLTLGGELFAQGTASQSNRKRLVLNGGGTYNFTKKYSLLFSAGHSIAGERYFVGYFGLALEM